MQGCTSPHKSVASQKCISKENATQVAVSIASARLDNSNLVLYKTSQSNISKLQRAQNSLARVVKNSCKRDHITPIFADLHWLPIAARIDCKIALLTFKSLVSRQPSYLCELFDVHQPTRSLRSSSQANRDNRLNVIRSRTSFGCRAYCLELSTS